MLEGLDRIDWNSLDHAYGEARNIPELLRALISPKVRLREGALWALYGNIFHQGTRYPATVPAIPFLFELVESPATPDRHRLIDFLLHLALGYPEAYLPYGVKPEHFPELVDIPAVDPEDYESVVVAAQIASYRAVEAGVALFVKLTGDSDPQVRQAAVYSLAWFPQQAALSAPRLRQIVQTETEPTQRANALLTLALLDYAQSETGDRPLFVSLLNEEIAPLVRFASAAALGIMQPSALPSEALPVLLTAVGGAFKTEDDEEPALLWNEGDLAGFASLILGEVGKNATDKERIIDALCTALSSVPPMSSLTLTRVLLDTVFGQEWNIDSAPPLSVLQKRTLQAIADHGAWRLGDSYFVNYDLLFHPYGFPGSEEKFREFVRALPS